MSFEKFVEAALNPLMLAFWGACIGSFLNVVAYRLPKMMERDWWIGAADHISDTKSWNSFSKNKTETHPECFALSAKSIELENSSHGQFNIAVPRSTCPCCGHKIPVYENIPVLSWFLLGGKCSSCHSKFSFRYPSVELFTSLMFVAIGWRFGFEPVTFLWCAFASALITLSIIDWDTTFLPDEITLPLLWSGLIAAQMGLTIPVRDSLIGAVFGYLSLWMFFWVFKLITKKDGMGFGDFKLLAAIGAWMGFSFVAPVILMSSIIGSIAGLAMKTKNSLVDGKYIPFGPFIAGSALFILLSDPYLGFGNLFLR